jgi:hypothetical protein
MPQDEGQHVQTVFPPAYAFGNASNFAFKPQARLTEASPLATDENRDRLGAEWSRYWDTSKPVLLEKSPPNIIRTRFLDSLFPKSLFVMMLRHPIAVSYATHKYRKVPLISLLRHWLHAHRLLAEDLPHLHHILLVRYEAFVVKPQAVLDRVWAELGLESSRAPGDVRADGNAAHFTRWGRSHDPFHRAHRRLLTTLLEGQIAQFGYSLRDVEYLGPAPALGGM